MRKPQLQRRSKGRLVAEAAAARHLNEDTNAAAAETEQAEGRLVAEAAATRNLGEDANAAAAHNLGEDAIITAAQNLGDDTNAAAATKKKAKKTGGMSRSKENKNDKINDGDDEIRRLIDERRITAKGDKHQLRKLSKRIKKCIWDRKKNKKTRTDTADSGGFQRHQKCIMHQIWKEKNTHPESEK